MTLNHLNNVIIMFLRYKTMGFDVSLGKLMNSEFSGGHLGSHLGLQLTGPYLESTPKFFKHPRGPLHGSKVKIWGPLFAHSSRTTQNFLLLILVIIHIKSNKTEKFQVWTPSCSRITAPLKLDQVPQIKFDILHRWP